MIALMNQESLVLEISIRSTCWLFQIVYEGEIRSLFTVTFLEKVDFLIMYLNKLLNISNHIESSNTFQETFTDQLVLSGSRLALLSEK